MVRETCDLIDFARSGWFGAVACQTQNEVFLDYFDNQENPSEKFKQGRFDTILEDGSILLNVTYRGSEDGFILMAKAMCQRDVVFNPVKWRESINLPKIITTVVKGTPSVLNSKN